MRYPKKLYSEGKLHAFLLDDSAVNEARQNTEIEIYDLQIDILQEPLCVHIGVRNQPMTLADIVPLARLLCTKVVCAVTQSLRNDGDSIACHKGCSACCRYLVPVSIPEAFCLAKEVVAMPDAKRRFMDESSLLSARCILEATPESFLGQGTSADFEGYAKLKDVSRWYSEYGLPCPFLLDNVCTIYEQRPLACREHMVIGEAGNCEATSVGQPQVVQMPVSVLASLAQLTSEVEHIPIRAIMLPFALAWCYDNSEYTSHAWPAPQLVGQFVNIFLRLQNTGSSNPELLKAISKSQ